MLLFIAVIYTFLICISQSISEPVDNLTKASRLEFPSYVKVGDACGGVLLDSISVLTSAACNVSIGSEVRAGTQKKGNVENQVVFSRVKKFKPHENYAGTKEDKLTNGIAIIELETPIHENGNFIKYAKLPSQSMEWNTSCTVVGLGGEFAEEIQKLTIDFLPIQQCFQQPNGPSYSFLCGISKPTRVAESNRKWEHFTGGPLYCDVNNNQIVYGVGLYYGRKQRVTVKFNQDSDEMVDGFLRTVIYKDWIEKMLKRLVLPDRKFPSYVEIKSDKMYCGGALLDSTTVLTSIDCLPAIGNEVLAGESIKIVSSHVKEFIKHKEHKDWLVNNIAIIKLDSPIFEEQNYIKYAKLPVRKLIEKRDCYVVGLWRKYSNRIEKFRMNFLSIKQCLKQKNPMMFLCGKTNKPTKRQSEDFDRWHDFTGAPLYCNVNGEQILYGVGLYYDRKQKLVAIYEKVDGFIRTFVYKDWIYERMNNFTRDNLNPPRHGVSRREFPSYVEIDKKYDFCGGVLLDSTTVLTTAKCNPSIGSEVRVGKEKNIDSNKVIISHVKKFIPHEDFSVNEWLTNDIAIIKLETPIQEEENFVKYAKIPERTWLEKPSCTAVAFGGEYFDELIKFKVNLLPNSDCKKQTKSTMFTCGIGSQSSPDFTGYNKWDLFTGGPLYCDVDNERWVYGLGLYYSLNIDIRTGEYKQKTRVKVDGFIRPIVYKDWINEKLKL